MHIVVVMAAVIGFAVSLIFIPSNITIQMETAESMRGRVYGFLNALIGAVSFCRSYWQEDLPIFWSCDCHNRFWHYHGYDRPFSWHLNNMNFFIVFLLAGLFISLFSVYYLSRDDLILLRKDVTIEKIFNLAFVVFLPGFFCPAFLWNIVFSQNILEPSKIFPFSLFPRTFFNGRNCRRDTAAVSCLPI